MLRKYFSALLCAFLPFSVVLADTAMTPENLYIRDALAEKGVSKGLDKSPELEKLVAEFRKDQLARLALQASLDEGMPDFNARAEELYQARKDKQYLLPLRLRVRMLEMAASGNKEAATRKQLADIRSQVSGGKLDFKAAVLQYSEEPERKLSEGDSQWFSDGQKPDAIYAAAEKLSTAQPLSDVIVQGGTAYLLYFLDRKEAETRSLEAVKPEIIAELQQEYRQDQEKVVLDSLREKFKQNAKM
jgi:hypothetical protein